MVWAKYRQHPSKYSYDDLMQLVPSPERARWHERAIQAAMAADLSSLIGLLCETGEIERLPTSAVRSHTWVTVAIMPQVTGSRAAGMAVQVAKV